MKSVIDLPATQMKSKIGTTFGTLPSKRLLQISEVKPPMLSQFDGRMDKTPYLCCELYERISINLSWFQNYPK
jgi:hypothetical protein